MSQKNEKENQHYVPKCYLRNFTNGKEFIATFMHSKNKFVKQASLDSVVAEKYFYGKDLIIENMFQKFEGEWAGAFRNFNNIEGITDDELAQTIFQIMTFIAFQNSRTLKVYDAQKGFDGFLRNYIYENSYSAASANELLNKYLPEGYNLMEAPINVSFSTIETFKDLSLLCIENQSDVDFITSDNPVVLYNKFLVSRSYKGNYGLSSIGLSILVPISPRICICLFDPKVYYSTNNEMHCVTSKETVLELNRLFCRNAYEFIFFTQKHTEEYATELDGCFVDKLESKTSIVQSNLGPVIHFMTPSILENFELPFITLKKISKRINIPVLGPAPQRYFRKT